MRRTRPESTSPLAVVSTAMVGVALLASCSGLKRTPIHTADIRDGLDSSVSERDDGATDLVSERPDVPSSPCWAGHSYADGLCEDPGHPDVFCRWYVPGADEGSWMCRVEADVYPLGCNENSGRSDGEPACPVESRPAVLVKQNEAFYLDRFEVTNRRYREYLSKNPTVPVPDCDAGEEDAWNPGTRTVPDALLDHPVVCVTAAQAEAFCAWAGKRLPTESEWEAAARGTAGFDYPWGASGEDKFQTSKAQCYRDWGDYQPAFHCLDTYEEDTCPGTSPKDACKRTAPVVFANGEPTLPAGRSPAGLYHVVGNAAEWTADGWTGDHRACETGGCEDL